jgi:hypothetical protein
MFSDNTLLYVSTALVALMIILCHQFGKAFQLSNTFLFLFYTIFFYHGLYSNTGQGAALGWWFYHLVVASVHFIVLLLLLLRKRYRT